MMRVTHPTRESRSGPATEPGDADVHAGPAVTKTLRVPGRKRTVFGFGGRGLTALSLTVALILWELLGRLMGWRALPPLSDVGSAWLVHARGGELLGALGRSGLTLLIGYMLALFAAVITSTATTSSRSVDYVLRPYLNLGMSIPVTALIPILMLLFGLGNETRIAVVFLFSYFTMVVSIQAGFEKADPGLVEMGQAYAAQRGQLFWKVRLPMAMPLIVAGARLGVSRAIHGLVNSEVIIATAGIGWLLIRASREFDIPGVYAVTGTIVVASLTLMGLLALLERKVVGGAQNG